MEKNKKSIFKQIKKLWDNQKYSSKHCVYWDIYEHIFSGYDLNKNVNILEIGVDTGTGMELLQKVFPNAHICGLDIRELTSTVGNVWIGDQKDPKLLDEITLNEGPFDIVIDDGSHIMEDQIKTFEYLFPKINPGGIYIVEDTHTSYWKSYGGGYNTNSFINYTKKLTDLINYWSWKKGYQSLPNYEWTVNQNDVNMYNSYNINPEIFINLNCISSYPNIVAFFKSNKEWEYQANDSFIEDDLLYRNN